MSMAQAFWMGGFVGFVFGFAVASIAQLILSLRKDKKRRRREWERMNRWTY